jgi:hypothetical protein
MEIIIFFAVLVALNLAALRWGTDSREPFNSPEWERRRRWRTPLAQTRSR